MCKTQKNGGKQGKETQNIYAKRECGKTEAAATPTDIRLVDGRLPCEARAYR